jgi:hypothetical protein
MSWHFSCVLQDNGYLPDNYISCKLDSPQSEDRRRIIFLGSVNDLDLVPL